MDKIPSDPAPARKSPPPKQVAFSVVNSGGGLSINEIIIFGSGGATPAPELLEGANHSGDVDIVDALAIAQAYVGLNPANYNASLADVDCSGSVNIVAALMCAQYYVGLINQFC